jgi:UDP-N-acetylglucosamine 3-dehydrogenase
VIRLALAGAGAHGRDHARAVEMLRSAGRDVRIELVVDLVPSMASALAGAFGVPAHGPAQLLETVRVDAVIVCAGTDDHLGLARICAELPVPTLIDKPLATTLEHADEIVAAFVNAGVPLFPGQSTRFHPALRRLKALIEDGRLGDVGLVATHHAQGYAWPGAWHAWRHEPARSGGQIVHLGIHDIDLTCWLAGAPPSWVRAVFNNMAGKTGADLIALGDDVRALLNAARSGRAEKDVALNLVLGGHAVTLVGQHEGQWLDAKR